MLYLTRKIGESVVINDEIEVTDRLSPASQAASRFHFMDARQRKQLGYQLLGSRFCHADQDPVIFPSLENFDTFKNPRLGFRTHSAEFPKLPRFGGFL